MNHGLLMTENNGQHEIRILIKEKEITWPRY